MTWMSDFSVSSLWRRGLVCGLGLLNIDKNRLQTASFSFSLFISELVSVLQSFSMDISKQWCLMILMSHDVIVTTSNVATMLAKNMIIPQ